MVKTFKKIFVPHEANDFKPHFFREISITAILIVIIVLFATSAGSSFVLRKTDLGAAVLPAVLVDLTNENRVASGGSVLTRSVALDAAARLKAEDMARNGYFAHTSPEGLTPWHWFEVAGYHFIYAGENLAINFTESVDVENAWLNSPLHRANILNARFSEIGIATTEGIYNGTPTTFVVQMFGTPVIFASELLPTTTVSEVKPTPTPTPTPSPTPIPVKTTPPKSTTVASAGEAQLVGGAELETIVDTKEFTAVKNVTATEATPAPTEEAPVQYAKWYERFLFNQPQHVTILYYILATIIFLALISMIVIEFKRQHPKNIMYGVLVCLILVSLLYINQTAFVPHFII